ncbi:MAG: bifunctional diaminohydroxyphosphoribosylaminopyrimidine deaminase/5-amino-6-(5-phosphoribosylamino)uracil reductase RibD [Bacteroidales bacterium]
MLDRKDENYMRRCLELAGKGLGLTRTNPLVGCVIVYNDRIIGEGYHHEFGGPHAEVNAIRSVKDHSLLNRATLYANLEPCAHQGKTPPCSMLIRQRGIPRVVISNIDPFPSVNGRGIRYLRDQGAEVEAGCLEKEGYYLNRRFFTYHVHHRPYVILKWARSKDGFLDFERKPSDPIGTNWITDQVGRTLVHKWRSEEAGIMVGTSTVITDNPRLNLRRWAGSAPVRVTIDRKGRISRGSHILDGSQDTIVFTGVPGTYSGKTRSIHIDSSYGLEDLLEELADQKIISLLVEGGAALLNSFLESGLWDEARVFTGKKPFTRGVPAPEIEESPDESEMIGGANLDVFRNKRGPVH